MAGRGEREREQAAKSVSPALLTTRDGKPKGLQPRAIAFAPPEVKCFVNRGSFSPLAPYSFLS